MSRKTICKSVLTVALALAACTAPVARAAAQSTASSGSSSAASNPSGGSGPNIVTGTDPEPDYVGIMLDLLGLA